MTYLNFAKLIWKRTDTVIKQFRILCYESNAYKVHHLIMLDSLIYFEKSTSNENTKYLCYIQLFMYGNTVSIFPFNLSIDSGVIQNDIITEIID
jgi:hypothetical protein